MAERQPLFAAMDTLRGQALDSDLFNPLGPPVAEDRVHGGPDLDEQLCGLRLHSYSWNHEFDPAALYREGAALDRVLHLAQRLADSPDDPHDLGAYAADALTLRALRGRPRVLTLQAAPG